MKKIIYSLVIMIAAGSLFTSCIEQVEPLGIQDMRFAKAEYIRALKDLRAADAEYVRAQAAFELARARYKDAQTANLNADTEYQKLLNEYQQLLNEARQDTNDFISQETANKIDSIKKRMELRELEHQKNMVAAQDSLANAQERLRIALRNIALYSQSLTPAEQSALADAVYMYETAFEVAAAQDIKVLKLQYKLDSLKAAAAVGDTVYDKSSKAYIGQVNKWKKDIEANEVEQALLLALLLAVPDSLVYDDVDGWKEQVDKLVADSTAADYQRYQTKVEMSQYYTANIHDGVEAFNDAVTLFKAENWENGTVEPAFSSADSATLAKGEPKQADYKMKNADTIAMPALKFETPNFAYDGFKNMTSKYFGAFANNAPGATGNYQVGGEDVKMMVEDGDYWKLYVNQNWKDFVLGTDKGTVKSQNYVEKDEDGNVVVDITSDYGLKGAVSVLERKRVYKEEEGLNYADSLKKYKDVWSKHRDTLSTVFAYYPTWKATNTTAAKKKTANGGVAYKSDNGYLYGKYAPYTTAIDAYKTDKDAYDDAVEEVEEEETNLIGAIKTLKAEFDKVDGKAGVTYNDSLAIFNALKDFAAKREAYLGYKYSTKHKLDSTKFYYGTGIDYKGDIVISSIKIADMTFDDLRAKKYDRDTVLSGGSLKDWGTNNAGLVGMARQILNDKFATAIDNATMDFTGCTADAFDANTYRALYNNYKIDDYTKPTKITVVATGSEYEKKVDNSKLVADSAAIRAAIEKYEGVYNSYWGRSTYPGIASEVNPKSYTDTTFTDPFPIVNFNVAGTEVDTTAGLATVLESIDKQTSPEKVLGSDVHSDFWVYMKWLDKNGTIDEDSLNKIKEWVSAVEHAFALDAEAAGMPDTAAYNAAKEEYNEALANKKAYDDYIVAKKAFTGVDKDGNPNDIVELTDPAKPIGTKFDNINDVLIPELVEQNVLGTYTGEWAEGLGGTQLELAKTLFPEYPTNILAWDATIEYVEDILEEYGILIQAAKQAYFAAAKIAGENVDDATNWDELVKNYKAANKKYRKGILDKIEALQTEIDQWEQNLAKWQVGAPAREIEIAETANALKVETARLQGYEQALAYAKANLDKLMEYIKSLDANFVIPAVDFGPDEDED